jgi:hypothetical protein
MNGVCGECWDAGVDEVVESGGKVSCLRRGFRDGFATND